MTAQSLVVVVPERAFPVTSAAGCRCRHGRDMSPARVGIPASGPDDPSSAACCTHYSAPLDYQLKSYHRLVETSRPSGCGEFSMLGFYSTGGPWHKRALSTFGIYPSQAAVTIFGINLGEQPLWLDLHPALSAASRLASHSILARKALNCSSWNIVRATSDRNQCHILRLRCPRFRLLRFRSLAR
jgi:hypothetical protein